jgi:MFS family permease
VSFKLCRSQKIALLSALIISLNSDILIIGMYSIARSVASFFLVVLLLIFLSDRTTNKKETTKMLALALCLTLAIIVFHTVSILFILSMLLVVYVLQKFLVRGGGSPIVSGKYLLASIAITAAYWLIFARNLVDLVVSDLTASETMTMALPTAASGASTSELFNYLQYMPLLLFVIVGILIVLRSQRFGKEMKLFGIATLLFIPLAFPGPLLLIGKLNENFDLSRFNEYTFLFMGILAAVGLAVLYQRNSRLLKALCIVVFAAWILFSVSNDFVASDNPLVKRTFYTSYMTESEITGMDSILGITQASAGYMLSDYVSGRYVQFSSLGPDYPFQPTVAEAYAPDNLLLKSNSSDVILIRENELAKRPMKLVNLTTPQYNYAPHESQIVYFDMDDGVFDNLGEMNQIYNSSAVVGYN